MFKAKDAVRKVTHIYSKDPALDTAHADYNHGKYVDTHDETHLPRKNGISPVRFVISPPTGHGHARLKLVLGELLTGLEGLEEAEKRTRALQAYYELVVRCVVGAENALDTEGHEVELTTVHDGKERVRKLSDQSIELLLSVDSGNLLYELGARCMREVFGDPLSVRE